eukprot:m.5868 g.5868  ORF g.5868 m.5868 type:complete len:166 (-) comp4708_c0_seq1:529-1026(-)
MTSPQQLIKDNVSRPICVPTKEQRMSPSDFSEEGGMDKTQGKLTKPKPNFSPRFRCTASCFDTSLPNEETNRRQLRHVSSASRRQQNRRRSPLILTNRSHFMQFRGDVLIERIGELSLRRVKGQVDGKEGQREKVEFNPRRRREKATEVEVNEDRMEEEEDDERE